MRRVDDPDGGVRIVGYARDVTVCKQAEVQAERMHAIVATVSEGLSVTDERGRCLVFNPQMEAITGYTAADAESPGLFTKLFPDRHTRARAVAHMQRARRGIEVVNQEWRIVRKDGDVRDVLVSTRVLGGPTANLLLAVRDVTNRRRVEEQRWAVERRLREAERLDSLGVMAGGIAHDFNNLLQTILGFGELAAAAVPGDSPAASALAQVQLAGRRAAELTRQMLAYAGRTRYVPRRCALDQVLRRAEPLLAASLRAGVRLELQLGADLPPPVDADPAQLRQVLINLVANAGEALTERDGLVVLRAGTQRCDRAYLAGCYPDDELPAGAYAFFEVEDDGCGMNAVTRAHLFDPFFSTKFTGRGLGLAAVLGVVRGHRGALAVRSEPGRGTTIRVLLPAVT
jgi:PAS domain S-box-containing protein